MRRSRSYREWREDDKTKWRAWRYKNPLHIFLLYNVFFQVVCPLKYILKILFFILSSVNHFVESLRTRGRRRNGYRNKNHQITLFFTTSGDVFEDFRIFPIIYSNEKNILHLSAYFPLLALCFCVEVLISICYRFPSAYKNFLKIFLIIKFKVQMEWLLSAYAYVIKHFAYILHIFLRNLFRHYRNLCLQCYI